MEFLHFPLAGAISQQHRGSLGLRQKSADGQHSLTLGIVRPQNRIRRIMAQLDDFPNLFFQHRPYLHCFPIGKINITNLRI